MLERTAPMRQDNDPPPPIAPEANPNLLRDRLANERTFLSWLRTGIAVTGLGFVVARFDIFLSELVRISGTPVEPRAGVPIGLVLVAAGPFLVVLAAYRYSHTDHALVDNRPESRQLVRSIIFAISACAVIAGILLVIHLISTWPK
jgi:putative membrane protein